MREKVKLVTCWGATQGPWCLKSSDLELEPDGQGDDVHAGEDEGSGEVLPEH